MNVLAAQTLNLFQGSVSVLAAQTLKAVSRLIECAGSTDS